MTFRKGYFFVFTINKTKQKQIKITVPLCKEGHCG